MSAVIVPINVQALSVPNGTGPEVQFASGRVNYENLAGHLSPPPIAATCDTTTNQAQPPIGVHLHWALPGAMTCHADWSTFEPSMTQPGLLAAPDLWLVLRINPAFPTGSPDFLQSWVVQSSACGATPPENGYFATMPVTSSPGQPPYAILGSSMPAVEWSPPDPSTLFEGLTALGHGLGHFAGSYQDCPNVFGMYDPQGDTLIDPVSYLVVGWYNTPESDPLNTPRSAEDLATYLNWQVAGAAPTDAMPTQTVFAGFVSGVGAPYASSPAPLNTPTLAPAQIAVGSGVPSAIAALVSRLESEPDPAFARILTAFQYGRLDLADDPDAAAQIEDMLHRLSFRADAGHELTVITPREGQQAASLSPPYPAIAAQLGAVNTLEVQAETLSRQIAALSGQLAIDWQNYIIQANSGGGAAQIEAVMTALLAPDLYNGPTTSGLAVSQVIDAVTQQLATTTQMADAERQTLTQLCTPMTADGASPLGYHVASAISPSYYTPLPPAFAVSSSALEGPDRIGDSLPGDGPALLVRLSDQLLSGLSILSSSGPAAVIDTSGFATNLGLPAGLNAALVEQLLVETILVDPCLAPIVSTAASVTVASSTINTALTAAWPTGAPPAGFTYSDMAGDSVSALPPAIGAVFWSGNPWLPLFLRWRGTLLPFGTPGDEVLFDPSTLLDTYQLSNADTELFPVDAPATLQGVAANFSGLGTLSANNSITLLKALQSSAPSDLSPTELTAIEKLLVQKPIHTGVFSNIYEQALQQSRAPQLPPMDLVNTAVVPPYQAFAAAMATAATPVAAGLPTNYASPNTLLPLVGGAMTDFTLTVVDCFGQMADLVLESAWPTDDVLEVPPNLQLPNYTDVNFLMPPRIALPARTLAQWVIPGAGGPMLDNPLSPAGNPVRGWVLPSFSENSVLLYDAMGTPLAELTGAGGFSWRATPGSPIAANAGDQNAGDLIAALTALKTIDAAFIEFVTQMTGFASSADDDGGFQSFVEMLGDIAPTIQPSRAIQDPASLALVGRPLAVVCASVDVSLRGPGPVDQSASAFTAFVNAMQSATVASPPSRDTSGIDQVNLPLLVGDDARLDDGMYGFFLADGSFCAAMVDPPVGAVSAASSQVSLTLGSPLQLTLLMDPAAPVHFATGLLPVISLSVPSAYYRSAIKSMAFTMPVGPILTAFPGVAGVALPMVLPSFGNGDWSWTQPTQGANGMQWGAPLPTSQLPPNQVSPGSAPLILEGWLSLPLADAE